MALDRLSLLSSLSSLASSTSSHAHAKPLSATFILLFTIFVIAMVVLIFLTLRYVIRRDRAGRAAWLERQVERQRLAAHALDAAQPNDTPPPPSRPATNR